MRFLEPESIDIQDIRRLAGIGVFLPLLALWLVGCGGGGGTATERVPVLILALDTLRADHLGCYGHPFVETPALDALAAESVLFENCTSPATWTLPGFTSAWTGLYPYRHGVVGGERVVLSEEHSTFPEQLKGIGYRTKGFAAVGYFRPEVGLDRGIDSLEVFLTGPTSDRSSRYQPQVLRWIESAPTDSPWFLLVHYYDAHAPYEPPPPYDRRYYQGDPYDPAHSGLEMLNTSNNRAIAFRDITSMYTWMYGVTDPEFAPRQYAADVAALDRRVGEVMDLLRESGWLDRMLVVVMADHGEHLNEHSCWYTHAYPYEECLRVPLMIRLPGGEEGGRRVSDEVSLVDLYPTLAELLGFEAPEDLDGVSLVPALAGRALPGRILQAEQGVAADKHVKALWDSEWRFLSFRMPSESWIELYDRKADRAESRNVAAAHPDQVKRFEEELLRRFPLSSPVIAPGLAESEPISAELRQRLRSLGYVH